MRSEYKIVRGYGISEMDFVGYIGAWKIGTIGWWHVSSVIPFTVFMLLCVERN